MAFDHNPTGRGLGLTSALALLIGAVALGGCLPKRAQFEGVAPMKRNEVDIVHLTHEVRFGAEGAMAEGEAERLTSFLSTTGVGYGDVLQLDSPEGAAKTARRNAIAAILMRHGLQLTGGNAVIGLAPNADTVRLIVTRHTVTSPGCPDWSQPSIKNWHNGQSSNHGCANATNLGAMIADPAELLAGTPYGGAYAPKAASAVETYRNTKGTGAAPQQGGGGTGTGGGTAGN